MIDKGRNVLKILLREPIIEVAVLKILPIIDSSKEEIPWNLNTTILLRELNKGRCTKDSSKR